MGDPIYAEDVNYFQTSKKSPDTWMMEAQDMIASIGGLILGEAFGNDPRTGQSAYMLQFSIEGSHYKVIWPVLESKKGLVKAARVQAATFLFHDIKAKCMTAKVLGTRAAFFSYLLLPDGRTTTQATVEELEDGVPQFMITAGREVLDG